MKKLILLVFSMALIMGCGQAAIQSGFYDHDTMYKNWDHLKFSWFGHRNPTDETLKESQEQGWWGIEVPHVPGDQ